MPSLFEKYVVKEISKEVRTKHLKNSNIYYANLDIDEEKERIEVGQSTLNGDYRLLIKANEFYPMPMLIGDSTSRKYHSLSFGDLNGNGVNEIFCFAHVNNKLVLNQLEIYNLKEKRYGNFVNHYYVPELADSVGVSEWLWADSEKFFDIDNDGFDELIFVARHYRQESYNSVFIFDYQDKTFSQSRIFCDSEGQIHLLKNGVGNQKKLVMDGGSPFRPSSMYLGNNNSYLKVFDSKLDLQISPLQFPQGRIGFLNVEGSENNKHFALWSKPFRMDSLVLYQLSDSWEKIDSLSLTTDNPGVRAWAREAPNDKVYLYYDIDKISVINKELALEKEIALNVNNEALFLNSVCDLNEDGIKEYVLYQDKSNSLFIFSDEFEEVVDVGNKFKIFFTSDIKINKNHFFCVDNDYSYIFSFRKNPYRLLEFPVYAGIYLLIVFFSFVIRKTQEARLKEKYELQNKVRELQLQSLNNQLDPHFIFNTFNTVASVIRQGKSEDAYNLMVRFSKLVRQNMEGSGDIYTTLQKELNFIEDYLSIQKFRFKELLDYSIVKPRNVNAVKIPKLLIQIHVENALKHGIRPSNKRGMLKVIVKYEVDSVLIEVEDNGVGRSKSKKLKTQGQGIGLKAIKEIIEINNINSKHNITQQIIDLKDEAGLASGTRVCLKVTV